MLSRIDRFKGFTTLGLALCTLLQGCNGKPDAKPATTAVAADAPVLSIPIQRDGHWVVEALGADNQPHRVLLDTGASLNMLNNHGPLAAAPLTPQAEAAFLRQGLLREPTTDGAVAVDTASDSTQIKLGLSPALRIGGWTMPAGALALRSDSARLFALDDAPFDGIVGNENMRKLTWRADYVAGRLTAYANEAPAHEWQQCTFMTFDTMPQEPVIELRLGNESSLFIVDTGDTGDVALTQGAFEALVKAQKLEHVSTGFSYDAMDRFVAAPEGLLSGLTIGQKPLPRVSVGAGATPRIGMGLLEKMDRFEMDFRHYRFCFDLPAVPKDSVPSTMGAALQRSGDHYVIAALAPQGRLATSGIEMGDQITMVEQTPVATLKFARLLELLNAPTTGEVTVQRGERTLVLKLKPA